MGKLIYGHSEMLIEFEDRFLAHAQLVIGPKLRRHENFFFSWVDDASVGSGHSTIWLDTSIPLYFRFAAMGPGTVNREWIDLLRASADSPQGLVYIPEPGSHRTTLPKSQV